VADVEIDGSTLHDEGYGRLVVGVEDPEATAASIKAALGRKQAAGILERLNKRKRVALAKRRLKKRKLKARAGASR
jgi:hypothetical protein